MGWIDPDEGKIRTGDSPVGLRSPADAIATGIGMVHQHFMLMPTNVCQLGRGFIAIVVLGRWHPAGVALAAFVFGATSALQLAGRVHAPASLGTWIEGR